MANPQSELCVEILRRLQAMGALQHMVVVGSWCLLFYRRYFADDTWLPAVRTRDMDMLVPEPGRLDTRVDLAAELRDLGFVPGFRGTEGYMMLQHPELILEFLVPERGRGQEGPCEIHGLGVNAQALRFMDMLAAKVIRVPYEGMDVPVPHPAYYAVHKLIVSERRGSDKRERDLAQAVVLLQILRQDKAEQAPLRGALIGLSARWRTRVLQVLREAHHDDLADFLGECLPN